MIRRIAQFSINRPATIIILIAALSIIGVMSVVQMRTDLLPEMDLPYAIVMTTYSGAGPEEIEEQVSKPIENVVATVSDIDTLMSQSSANSSIVIIGFNYGTNMDSAMADIRDKISMAESYLPEDADKPMVMKINPNIMPVIAVAIGSDQLSLAQLQSVAEDDIEPRLSRISGVASVTVLGGLEREVKVAVDPVKAQNYGLSLTQIGSFLAAENYNMSSGDISYGEREYFVRSLQEFESVDAVGEVALTAANGNKIQLKEIAEISEDYKEVEQLTRVNKKPAVSLLVQKATDGNTVEACTKVKEEMEKIRNELGGKINVEIVMDQSDNINKSLNSTTRTLAEGAVLAVLIIFLFMRNLRSTAIVGIAIPLSLLATFIVLFYNGSTLNLLTLGGLALGVGRMIDDSIVVFENIYRHRDLGLSAPEAALKGTAEVGGAVLASTLTLIAVFLPIGLAEGISGVLFKPLALTICVAIACSLMVSLAVVPFMSSRMLTDKAMVKKGTGKFFLSRQFHRLGEWLDNLGEKYKIGLRWALGHRRSVIFSVVVLIVLSLAMVPQIGAEFMPPSDSGEVEVTLEADKGAKLEDVDKLAETVEAELLKNPAVDIVYTTVGSSGEMAMMGAASNEASFRVQLIPKGERKGVEQVAEEIRESLKDIFGAKSTVSVSSGLSSSSSGGAIAVNIRGDDLDTLRSLSKQIEGIVAKVPGTRNVASSLGDGNPEVQLRINRQRAMDFGLTPAQVSSEIKAAIDGSVVSRFRLEGDEIDVTVTSTSKETSDMDTLKDLPILTAQGNSIPLSEVASFELSTGPVQIDRENQTRQGTISCDLLNRDLSSVTQDIQAGVNTIKLPAGYTIDYGGENEQMAEAFSSLILALLMAIMLVYVVMVVQYESFLDPFVILFSLPGAIIGVVLALLVTGTSFSVNAFIGLIMLVGIAVANAIVYVDYLKHLLAAGMERTAALLETGRLRLRPILMTALATILAMIPLAMGLGEGSETNAPLAIVVIGGLLAATFVTLFLVPVVYSILDDRRQKRFKKKSTLNHEDKSLVRQTV
ncbi:efflux RND transporter permease subunit [Candidatus Formimonas warabiya]|uniref:Multidrug ABC transporter n=1 Tax=Formimonas warabiya TaxID=1761012 RepID=A0A3G1KMQ4_FORW1|nr:efflux RND transporter permease subunit [Candidatus Formimonas warabiya]ATW23714.1 multidrug ABC transporter [Candidatus Formimonas warabiya]